LTDDRRSELYDTLTVRRRHYAAQIRIRGSPRGAIPWGHPARNSSQEGCSHDEIIRWIPSLTHEEIRIGERYYLQHKDELDEYDRRIRAYHAEQIRSQRLRFPEREGSRHERLAQLRQLLQQRRQEKSGEGTRG